MNKVVRFPGETTLPRNPDDVLEEAKEWSWDNVVVIGFDDNGGFGFVASHPDGGLALWTLETAKLHLMGLYDGDDE